MTSAFSWQNAISFYSASFCTPRPNLPVTLGVSCLPTFAFLSPIMKRTSLLGVNSGRSYRSSQNHSTSASALLVVAQTWITVILNGLRLHPNIVCWTLLLTLMGTPFLLRDSCSWQWILWLSELNSPIPVHFSSLIHRMPTFTLAISCLTSSNQP